MNNLRRIEREFHGVPDPPEHTVEDYEDYLAHLPDDGGPDFYLDGFIHTLTECWRAPRPREIMPGLAFERSVGIIVSEPHVGKTLILLDLAIAMSTGQRWINWIPAEPVPTIVYALDSPEWESMEQARNIAAGRGLNPLDSVPDFALVCREPVRAKFGRFDITNPRHYDHVRSTALGVGARLIGLDSLSKLHNKEENDRNVMELVMGQLERLAHDTGAHVLVMHHTPVSGRMGRTAYAGRGSSVIAASIDLEIYLRKLTNCRVMDVLKARGSDVSDHKFTLDLEHVPHATVPRAVKWVVLPNAPTNAAGRPRSGKTDALRSAMLEAMAQPRTRADLQQHIVSSGLADLESAHIIVNNTLAALKAEGKVLSRQRGTWEVAT